MKNLFLSVCFSVSLAACSNVHRAGSSINSYEKRLSHSCKGDAIRVGDDNNKPIGDVTAVYIMFEGMPNSERRENAIVRFDFQKNSPLHEVIRSQSDGGVALDMDFFIFNEVETSLETLGQDNNQFYVSGFGERSHDRNGDGLADWATEVAFNSVQDNKSILNMTLKMNGNDSAAKRRILVNLAKCEAL